MNLTAPIVLTATEVRLSRVHVNDATGDLCCDATLYDADGTAITSAAIRVGDVTSQAWRGRLVRDLPTPGCCKEALASIARGGVEALEAHIVAQELVSGLKQADTDREAAAAEAARRASPEAEAAAVEPRNR